MARGVDSSTFWAAGPTEQHALMTALRERDEAMLKHFRYGIGIVAAMIFNANRGKDSKPMYPEDFVPGMESPRQKEQKRMTTQEALGFLKLAWGEKRAPKGS